MRFEKSSALKVRQGVPGRSSFFQMILRSLEIALPGQRAVRVTVSDGMAKARARPESATPMGASRSIHRDGVEVIALGKRRPIMRSPVQSDPVRCAGTSTKLCRIKTRTAAIKPDA